MTACAIRNAFGPPSEAESAKDQNLVGLLTCASPARAAFPGIPVAVGSCLHTHSCGAVTDFHRFPVHQTSSGISFPAPVFKWKQRRCGRSRNHTTLTGCRKSPLCVGARLSCPAADTRTAGLQLGAAAPCNQQGPGIYTPKVCHSEHRTPRCGLKRE